MRTSIFLLLFASLGTAHAQQPVPDPAAAQRPQRQAAEPPPVKPEDRCTLEGTVVSAATGEPIRKAVLILMRQMTVPGAEPYSASTDGEGHFRFEQVDPGTYHFGAMRNGFVTTAYRSKINKSLGSGTPLTLSPRQALKDIVFRMVPQGVIGGRVLDEDGEPVPNVQVFASKTAFSNGKKRLQQAGMGTTNDKGEYRLFALPPGKYFIGANVRTNAPMGPFIGVAGALGSAPYASTYYPSVLSTATAIGVEVAPGTEVQSIDIKLLRVKGVTVAGNITGVSSTMPGYVMLYPKSEDGTVGWEGVRNTNTDLKQHFTFRGVTEGTYTIMAHLPTGDGAQQRSATATIQVGQSDLTNVNLAMDAAAIITGSVKFSGDTVPRSWRERRGFVSLSPVEETFGPGAHGKPLNEDGTFKIDGVNADKYRVIVPSLPEDLYVESVRFGQKELVRDILDFSDGATSGELSITVSADAGQVSGAVKDRDQKPTSGAAVVAIPDERDWLSRYRRVQSDQNGQYTLKGLAPGRYHLYAFDDVEWGAYQDADFMKPYERLGESVDVKAKSQETKDLTVIVTDAAPGSQQSSAN